MTRARQDHELLASSSAEDFEAFYVRHHDLVAAYLHRRASRPEVVLDLVAETFARALEHRRTYDPSRGPAIAWVLTIARNLLFDTARRGRVAAETRQRLSMQRIDLDDQDLAAIEQRHATPVLELLERLPEEQREAVRRRVLDEDPYPRIASDIGCSEQVVRQRVRRGLGRIRSRLSPERV